MSKQLESLGYKKQRCKTCGNDFWSIKNRSTCGDAPCDEYEFIGNPATEKKYDLYEIQNSFIEFFKENGHEPILRYPVLAKRWRDDVFLVGASIYNFQPWITSGLVEPPANPLTIAQPSIRLNDVDNVGRTGRHMTCFTMGAHHAFNKPEKEIYWKDKTIELCHSFIKSIGIDPEEITFIESWWQGGGNAGPCYEVCVRGVELATLVFMQYKILANGEKEEIPLKTVDTGYGLERFAWISQGTPTAYDACFSPVIEELKKIAKVKVNEEILAENAQIAGMMDIETFSDIRTLREKVAEKLSISMEDLLKSTEPMEAIYIIADHTRCLAFMLADGIIPSNVKEGYLARLVLRRTIRFMKELKINESLSDMMKIQLNFLTRFYSDINDSKEHIMNIINIEEERYFKTIEKGQKIVKRTIKNLKKQNINEMPLDSLMSLYDAHGMPPETVKEIAIANDFKVDVPDNFFTLIADSHTEEVQEEKDALDFDYPETELLFYKDFYQKQFSANVLGVELIENDLYLVLNQTAFYPEGGGQPSDFGTLNLVDMDNNDLLLKVYHAEKVNGVVLHKVTDFNNNDNDNNNSKDKEFFNKVKDSIGSNGEDISSEKLDWLINSEVKGAIEWNRRIALARNHTATHLIIAAVKEVLGDHIWQAGAQKGLKHSRIDLSHYKPISQDEINQIEKIANDYVMANLLVDTEFMSRDEAEKAYGFSLYQGGVVPGSQIRVVRILSCDSFNNNAFSSTESFENKARSDLYVDVQACAGTHVLKTGDIGLIKINRTERIQDGVERIDFSVGIAAIESMQFNDSLLRESSSIFKVTNNQLPKTCDRFFSEWKKYKNEIKRLQSEIASLKVGNLENDIVEINGLKVLNQILEADIKEMQKIATDFTDNGKVDVIILGNFDGKIVGASSKIAIDRGIKVNKIIKESASVLGGAGGGRPTLAQGAGPKANKMDDALSVAIDLLKEGLNIT